LKTTVDENVDENLKQPRLIGGITKATEKQTKFTE
jgi:hypothetical protein